MPLSTLQSSVAPDYAKKGLSLEETGWTLPKPRSSRNVVVHVDDRFQDAIRAKLTRLFVLNPKTDFEMVDLKELNHTLERARRYSEDVDFIKSVYVELNMMKYCPPLENRDGTYDVGRLKDFKRIITKVYALLAQLPKNDVKLFYDFQRREWKEGLLDEALATGVKQRGKKKQRVAPTRI